MQTLGLSGKNERSDGALKSIFWPTVQTAWDVDYLGQQGFWICFVIAVFQLITSLFTANPLLVALGLLGCLVYWTGGMGVREKAWPAAALIFDCYLIETLIAFMAGLLVTPVGLLRIAFLGLLLTNLRATFIASEWKPAAEGEDRPMRFCETLRDKLVDVWPPKIWPRAQIPFYVAGALWLLANLLSLAGFLLIRLGILPVHGMH